MQIAFLILLFILGACFGSFLCCQARRLHLKASKQKTLGTRSVCLSCKKPLKWYDNIPIISWIALKGKCRLCHHKIGAAELISELCVALAFLVLGIGVLLEDYALSSYDWIKFVATLIFVLIISFLAIYDGIYGELPTIWLTVSIIYAVGLSIYGLCQVANWSTIGNYLLPLIVSALILGGLYLLLYLISKGKWVGDGDWLLALAIGIALASPWLALIALFLTNILALIVAIPNLKKSHQIHLGPFMVAAFIITFAFSSFFLQMV